MHLKLFFSVKINNEKQFETFLYFGFTLELNREKKNL